MLLSITYILSTRTKNIEDEEIKLFGFTDNHFNVLKLISENELSLINKPELERDIVYGRGVFSMQPNMPSTLGVRLMYSLAGSDKV